MEIFNIKLPIHNKVVYHNMRNLWFVRFTFKRGDEKKNRRYFNPKGIFVV